MELESIVQMQNLKVNFYTYAGVVQALDGVNLNVEAGEILGLVGETGSGKSVTSLSVLRLVPPPGRIEEGSIVYSSEAGSNDILRMNESILRQLRGKDIAMIFQEPRAYLNPVYTVADQISEVMLVHREQELLKKALDSCIARRSKSKKKSPSFEERVYRRLLNKPKSRVTRYKRLNKLEERFHEGVNRFPFRFTRKRQFKTEITKEVVNILKRMEIPDPERVAHMYPHELSGGMAQRVIIAMALSCNPVLLIADEPTTNLDVTVQAQILNLVRQLKRDFHSSILYITHDLGVVAQLCDRVAVMYAGSIVETADVFEIFKNPLHPYTRALLESIPTPGQPFKSIRGIVPSLVNPPEGCRFHDRCSYAMEICRKVKPVTVEVKKKHFVSCFLCGGS